MPCPRCARPVARHQRADDDHSAGRVPAIREDTREMQPALLTARDYSLKFRRLLLLGYAVRRFRCPLCTPVNAYAVSTQASSLVHSYSVSGGRSAPLACRAGTAPASKRSSGFKGFAVSCHCTYAGFEKPLGSLRTQREPFTKTDSRNCPHCVGAWPHRSFCGSERPSKPSFSRSI